MNKTSPCFQPKIRSCYSNIRTEQSARKVFFSHELTPPLLPNAQIHVHALHASLPCTIHAHSTAEMYGAGRISRLFQLPRIWVPDYKSLPNPNKELRFDRSAGFQDLVALVAPALPPPTWQLNGCNNDTEKKILSNWICICLTSLCCVVVVCRLSAAAAAAAPRPSSSLLLHPCALSCGCRTGAWTEWNTQQRCTHREQTEQIGDGEETGGDSMTTGEEIFLGGGAEDWQQRDL
ncbi:hypothetical protein E2562_018434 [Oryza meyeriana var. granulata]|uniref:Uncharacterized protein n=1 Tax=Oryza meyeriana var. granulata TaxID=110450 RepID=A0A6G1EMD9_9ORYZ|nr:hypothetical protein E2562_018434 [Oryza meyeriana var. granulata]